jgi:DNA primase
VSIISRESIENIRQNVDICDVVSVYVQLKRIGSRWRGLSPFNHEKTPSFFVLPEKKIFKCFSSGHAGDVFHFLQLKENFSFTEAAEWLSHRYNLPLHYEQSGRSVPTSSNNSKALLDIQKAAETFYVDCWKSSDDLAERVRTYWVKDRVFSLQLAEQYSIGFAPPDDSGTLLHRLQKSFTREQITNAGLFYPSRNGTASLPRFRGRLMIPIRDIQGRTIGFSGRQLDGITPQQDPAHESKYINSPQTPIFNKGDILFGLDQARQHIQGHKTFLLVEGQLDTLRCHSLGLLTAIAPQGTGITEAQLHHLRRYSPSLWCFLDSDEAGQKAAMRVFKMALKEEMEVRFILLPEGQDPDSFLRDKAYTSLKDLESLACSAMTFAIRHLLPQGTASGIHEKERVLRTIFDTLSTGSSIIRETYLQEVSQLMGIDYRSIFSDFERFSSQAGAITPMASPANHEVPNPRFDIVSQKPKVHSVTYDLLSLIAHHEDLGAPLSHIIEKTWLEAQDPDHELLWHLLEKFREGSWKNWDHLDENFTTQECERLYTILAMNDVFEDPIGIANMCLRKLYKDYIQKAIEEITTRESHSFSKKEANIPYDEEDIKKLHLEKIHLRHLLKNPPQLPPQDTPQWQR